MTDNGSQDETPDILAEFATQGVVTSLSEPSESFDQDLWVTRMAHMAAERHARWIIHSDTDEFWIAAGGGSLADYFRARRLVNIVEATRHDFICPPPAGGPFWQRMTVRRAHSVNSLGKPLPPKIAHRGSPRVSVTPGNHDVTGFFWPRYASDGLEILHFPIRSREQYHQKIRIGARALAKNTRLKPWTGLTWRAESAELEQTGTTKMSEATLLSGDAIRQGLEDGSLLEDQRLRTHLDRIFAMVASGQSPSQ